MEWWEAGGYVSCPLTGPRQPICTVCRMELAPLLTAHHEWDPSTTTWSSSEDTAPSDPPGCTAGSYGANDLAGGGPPARA